MYYDFSPYSELLTIHNIIKKMVGMVFNFTECFIIEQ